MMNASAVRAVLNRGLVRDVMRIEMVTVVPEMTVYELAQTLMEAGIRSAPVLSPTGTLVGVASLTEVTRLVLGGRIPLRAAPDGPGARESSGARLPSGTECLLVRDMVGPVGLTVSLGEPLSGLVRRFVRARVQRALVVENDMLLGLVTAVDVLGVIDGSI